MVLHQCILFSALILSCCAGRAEDGLEGKVMCGYQGWFRVPADGSGNGWRHYSSGDTFDPQHCSIDLWPDVSELPEEDRFDTGFRYQDGSVAQVFSSVRPKTVDMHFRWMKEYGIDGVFLQRFAVSTRNRRLRESLDTVLKNVQEASRKYNRQWVLMYDLTGLKAGRIETVMDDWNRLKESHGVADEERDTTYLKHRDKPLIALWGLGFNDRDPMLDDWARLIKFFREEGFSVMVGVPTYWRTLERDTINNPRLHELIFSADVVSPWTVGRYDSPAGVEEYARDRLAKDIQWCGDMGIDCFPVAFPGFSWQNLMKSRGKTAKLDQIPRRGGEFLWSQCRSFQQAGAKMLYVAMFDELDEGTAIFKLRSDVPVGEAKFVSEPEVPNDRYLWLTGMAAKMLKEGRLVPFEELPGR